MNKKEMIDKLSEVTGVTKKDTKAILDAFPDVIKEAVEKEGKVSMVGFATFEKHHVEESEGTIQFGERKGEKWVSPAKDVINVKLSKSYKTL